MQETLKPRYYSIFRFYTTVGVTDRERETITALGEGNTVRVIGHNDPDAIDPKQVWSYLQETGIMPALEGKTIQGGALDGETHSDIRSFAMIDTHQPAYQNWTPCPEQVIAYPVLDVPATVVN